MTVLVSVYDNAWKEWMAGATPEGWICDALNFVFSDGSTMPLANHLDEQPQQHLRHENGSLILYTQIGFEVSIPEKQISTEYQLDVNMRPVTNQLLALIHNLRSSELLDPIIVEHRTYLLPDHSDRPVIVPRAKYYLATATSTHDALNLACLPPTLNRKRAGTAFRIEEFSGLARF